MSRTLRVANEDCSGRSTHGSLSSSPWRPPRAVLSFTGQVVSREHPVRGGGPEPNRLGTQEGRFREGAVAARSGDLRILPPGTTLCSSRDAASRRKSDICSNGSLALPDHGMPASVRLLLLFRRRASAKETPLPYGRRGSRSRGFQRGEPSPR